MIKRLLFLLLLGIAGTLLLRTYVVEGIYVASASMEPTLSIGRHLFLQKITLRFHAPHRGDIVVFPSPVAEGKDLIKRVIGLPGDEIRIQDKAVYINGNELKEPYVKFTRADERLEGDDLGPVVVPAGNVFLMGDNRDESGDSRDWKDPQTGEHRYFVPIAALKGTIIKL